MKKIGQSILLLSGWIACGLIVFYGINRDSVKNKKLTDDLSKMETIKQNPSGTFVDTAGREHVLYADGSTAKIPSSPSERKVYKLLRDSLAPVLMLTKADQVTQLTKVSTEDRTIIKSADLINMGDSLRIDKWSVLYRTEAGYQVKTNNILNTARFNRYSGIWSLKKTPMVSFSLDKVGSSISGYEKYETPLPVYRPFFKLDAQADYDFVLKDTRTDLNATFRIGRFSPGIFGRLTFDIMENRVTPSYGAKIAVNLAEL